MSNKSAPERHVDGLKQPAVMPSLAPLPIRRAVPLVAPPNRPYPALPSPVRPPQFGEHYTRTTHLIPAAYPRSTPFTPAPAPPPPSGADRKAIAEKVTHELYENNRLYSAGKLGQARNYKPMWNCINCYRRTSATTKPNAKVLTLFVTHANGFPKEVRASLCLGSTRG